MMTGGLTRALADHFEISQERWSQVWTRTGSRCCPNSASILGPIPIRFPDVVVDAAGQASGDLKATAPVLIAEVLSPSSERIDLGDKAAEYLRLPSLLAYLVFAQDEMKAWVWTRSSTNFPASADVFEGEAAVRAHRAACHRSALCSGLRPRTRFK